MNTYEKLKLETAAGITPTRGAPQSPALFILPLCSARTAARTDVKCKIKEKSLNTKHQRPISL